MLVVGGLAVRKQEWHSVPHHPGPLSCIRSENLRLGGTGSCLQKKSGCFVFLDGVCYRTDGQKQCDARGSRLMVHSGKAWKEPSMTLPHCPFWISIPECGTGRPSGSNNTPQEPSAASISLGEQCKVDTFSLYSLFGLFKGNLKEGESLQNSWALPVAGWLF